jgi:hypothetical protein
MNRSRRYLVLAVLLLGGLGFLVTRGLAPRAALAASKSTADAAALERARETVKMLDDLYKSAVVSITAKYVEQQSDTPAAAIAKEVFEAMHKKGWHHARLVAAAKKPKNKANLPATEFEKKATAQILAGKAYLEEIGEKDGKPVLRAATVVPSVMKQCAICHGGKEGRVLGAIVYEIPIK